MSFTIEREYPNAILRPLIIAASHDQTALPHNSQPSTSTAWQASVHSFVGTEGREAPRCWSPSRFADDPSLIPDDNKFDILYDASSLSLCGDASNVKKGYQLYQPMDSQKRTHETSVPAPRLVAKRYIPLSSEALQTANGLTLLILPGMGMPKEICEPMIEQLLPMLRHRLVKIDEIWTIDMPMSGETALANPPGYLYGNEKDISRDLLLFITAYLPVMAGGELPVNLVPREPRQPDRQPVRENLHIVAHSLGAQCAMLAAAHAPDIFSSLTVIDPAMIPRGKITDAYTELPKDVFCTMIEERHQDRGALIAALKSNKRTRGWDNRVMQVFADRGAIPCSEGGLRLAAHPRLEWALYYDKETPTHCYDRLTDIRTPFNAIMPSRPFAVPPKQFKADVAKMSQKTRITWVVDSTHQLPYEHLNGCAESVASWLAEFTLPVRTRL